MSENLNGQNIPPSNLSGEERSELISEVSRELRTSQSLTDIVDEIASQRLGLHRTDARVIDILDQRGGRATAGELASAAGLSPGAMTASIDRLERMGAVRRVSDPQDRRRVLVEVTRDALRRVGEFYGPIGEFGHRLLAERSDQELVFLRDFLHRGNEWMAAYAATLREGLPDEDPLARRLADIREATAAIKGAFKAEKAARKAAYRGIKAEAKAAAKEPAERIKAQTKAMKADVKSSVKRAIRGG
jgi:DNA-binding MarR family transcriptional regulator